MLTVRDVMELTGYRKPDTVHALMRGKWAVPGGAVRVPGRGRTGEFRVPLSFFQKWLAGKEVSR